MTIYLDYIFIENFLIDYILLKETSYISRKQLANSKAIISAIIASSYVVVMLYFKVQELSYLICKLLLVIIIIYISFKPRRMDEFVKLILFFFLMSVINVGTLTVITNLLNLQNKEGILKIIVYVLSLLLSKCFMKCMWKLYRHDVKNEDLIYEVKINLNGKVYTYNAFLDTGNNVFSYTYNMPVIFAELLDESILKELEKKESFYIRTVTLSSGQDKKAYVFDKVEIKRKEKTWFVKVAIVFERTKLSKDNSYNMLLNYILYVQDLGGIKI